MATSSTQLLMDQLRMQQAFARSTRPQTSGFSQALSYSSAIGRSYEAAATNLVRGVAASGARDIGAVREAMEKLTGYAEKAPVTHRQGIEELKSVLQTKENQLLRDSAAVDEMNLLKVSLDKLHKEPGHNESEIATLLASMKSNYISKSKETSQYIQDEIKAIYAAAIDKEDAYHKLMSVDADLDKEGFQAPSKFGEYSGSQQAFYGDIQTGYETSERTGDYEQFLELFKTPQQDLIAARRADYGAQLTEESSERAKATALMNIRNEQRTISRDRIARLDRNQRNLEKIKKADADEQALLITDIHTQIKSRYSSAHSAMEGFNNTGASDLNRKLFGQMPNIAGHSTSTSQNIISTLDAKGAIHELDLALVRMIEETADSPEDKKKAKWIVNAKNMQMDPNDSTTTPPYIRKTMMDDFIARNSDGLGPIPVGKWSDSDNDTLIKRYAIMDLIEARTMWYQLQNSGVLFQAEFNDETNDSEENEEGAFSLSKGLRRKAGKK